MKLKEYLRVEKERLSDFAEKIEVTQSYISQISNFKKTPSLDVALRIEKATKGKVTIQELAA